MLLIGVGEIGESERAVVGLVVVIVVGVHGGDVDAGEALEGGEEGGGDGGADPAGDLVNGLPGDYGGVVIVGVGVFHFGF